MKTVQVPATTRQEVDRTTCDFCQKTLPKRGHEYAEVTLQLEEGYACLEYGEGTKTVIDCCRNCWSDKVLPALQALGATPRKEEWTF